MNCRSKVRKMSRTTNFLVRTSAVLLPFIVAACLGKKIIHNEKSSGFGTAQPVGESRGSEADDGAKPAGDTNLANRPEICKQLDVPCVTSNAATFCELPEVAGATLVLGNRPHAFGAGECEARKAVLDQACKRGIDIKALDTIKCKADASGGKCPVTAGLCIALFAPARCYAAKFNGGQIPAGVRLAGWGANECVARTELSKTTCAQNLNPDHLQEVTCKAQERYQGDCPPPQPSCDASDTAAHECDVEMSTSPGGKLVAEGKGKCMARFNLDVQVCLSGQSPTEVSAKVSCRQK